MGMTIEVAIKQIIECKAFKQCDTEKDSEAFEVAIDTMRKYQMFQIDYEARLKADLVAMLIELQSDIEKESWSLEAYVEDSDSREVDLDDVDKLIQQKINELEGNEIYESK